MKCFFSFFFILPPLLSLKQRWVVLNFSSVRFSSVFVCRTESRVVVGSLSSQISPEWRLCVHYYISLFSLCDLHSLPLAGWLCILYEYLIGVSHHAHSTASTLAQLLTIDRPLFFSYFNFFFSFIIPPTSLPVYFIQMRYVWIVPSFQITCGLLSYSHFSRAILEDMDWGQCVQFIDGGGQWAQVLRWHWQLVDLSPPCNMCESVRFRSHRYFYNADDVCTAWKSAGWEFDYVSDISDICHISICQICIRA